MFNQILKNVIVYTIKKLKCKRGGFFQDLGRTFGFVSQKKPQIKEFKGTRPFGSLKEIPEVTDFLAELQRRRVGKGVGFRESELSAATSPFAAERRAGLKEQTIPLINAQASGKGLGRSTIPVNRIALASGEAERDIGQRIAQLRLANEQQRRAEINAAVQGIGQFGLNEADQQARRAGFDIGEFTRVEEATRADAIRRSGLEQKGVRRSVALVSSVLDAVASKFGFKQDSASVFKDGGQQGGGQQGTGAQVNTGQANQLLDLIKSFKR